MEDARIAVETGVDGLYVLAFFSPPPTVPRGALIY